MCLGPGSFPLNSLDVNIETGGVDVVQHCWDICKLYFSGNGNRKLSMLWLQSRRAYIQQIVPAIFTSIHIYTLYSYTIYEPATYPALPIHSFITCQVINLHTVFSCPNRPHVITGRCSELLYNMISHLISNSSGHKARRVKVQIISSLGNRTLL